jgi:AraC-like DNA-binding protein
LELLSLRSNSLYQIDEALPFAVYTAGTEIQTPITRLGGFSANQLFLTFSGRGRFRMPGQDKWDILQPHMLLYIPAGRPHEYMPEGDEPWYVGYVTFVEKEAGLLAGWGFGGESFHCPFKEKERLYELLKKIWSLSGPQHDDWAATEFLFAFCLELKKQLQPNSKIPISTLTGQTEGAAHPIVDVTVRFLHDHLERHITMDELAAHVGYSQKHLTRLFRNSLQMTPLQYLQQLRLSTAALLLAEQPNLTIRQAAYYIGMEPVYFTRLFRRVYGITPSESRTASDKEKELGANAAD